jgi:hypothetical protein
VPSGGFLFAACSGIIEQMIENTGKIPAGSNGALMRSILAGCNALEGFKPGLVGYMSGGVVGSNTWLALISHCYTPAY